VCDLRFFGNFIVLQALALSMVIDHQRKVIARFEVITAVLLKIQVFWDVTL
jgi:hypothetical protein